MNSSSAAGGQPDGALDRRGIDETVLRRDSDAYFPRTERTLFVRLHEARDYDQLWNSLLEIYLRPLLDYYAKSAGRESFPRLPGDEPEDVVHEYFLQRVRRADFRECSIYGKWLAWRIDPRRAHSNAIHFRHWIRTDFRNWCRDRAHAARVRAGHERGFGEGEERAFEDPAVEAAQDREMARGEVDGIMARAVRSVLEGYAPEKRRAIEAVLRRGGEKSVVASEIGVAAPLLRQWWCRFLAALRIEAKMLLSDLGYRSDAEIRALVEEIS